MSDWRNRPTLLEYWPENTDVLLGLDENGTSEINSFIKKVRDGIDIDQNQKHFTLTGVALNMKGYDRLKDGMNAIKYRYWKDGLYNYKQGIKRICLHSLDIRKNRDPFYFDEFEDFINDLSDLIDSVPAKVMSCSVDKEALCRKYTKPDHPYHLCVRYILERFCMELNKSNQQGALILESRGKKEDRFVLRHIVEILDEGTLWNKPIHFQNITGVYFNPKWWRKEEDKSSFVILELADLLSYPIHKYVRNNMIDKDKSFLVVEKKLVSFPDYMGRGLKLIP